MSSTERSDAAPKRELFEKTVATPIKLCSSDLCVLPEGHDAVFHVPLYVLLQEAGYVKGPWSK
jgi:hypothetical protein